MTTVAIAEDFSTVRYGLTELVNSFPDFKVIHEAENGQILLNKIERTHLIPDLCILDVKMPVMEGYETAAAIRDKWPDTRILAFSVYDEEYNIVRMLRNGARGYITKDTPPSELLTAMQTIMKEGFYYSPLVSGRMIKSILAGADDPALSLSEQELGFLAWLCSDLTYGEIADKMNLPRRTVDSLRQNLFDKLSVTSRSGLVVYAQCIGIQPKKTN